MRHKCCHGFAAVVAVALATISPAVAQDLPPLVNTVLAEASRDEAHLLHLFTVGQVPANHNEETVKILVNHGYVVGYSEERRNPIWASYRSSGVSQGDPSRFERPNFFTRDLRTVRQVTGETFGGGLDRGHMVPNFAIARQYGALAQMETFLMTNISPQAADLNRGAWRRLEDFITRLAEEREHMFAFVGPIFGDDPAMVTNGPHRRIQVPEAFYIILADTDREFRLDIPGGTLPTVNMVASIFPQTAPRGADFTDRQAFGASVDEIEERTNLDFFPLAASINEARWAELESQTADEFFELQGNN